MFNLSAVFICFILIIELQRVNSNEVFVENDVQKSVKQLHFNFNFNTNVSNHVCNKQLAIYQESLQQNAMWARLIRDSWGNVPSGLFSGNYFDLGNFDQCIDVTYHSTEVGEITGQHCTLMVPYDLEVNPEAAKISTPSRSNDVVMRVGICIPQSCSPEEVRKFSEQALNENFNLTLEPSYEQEVLCSSRNRIPTYVNTGVRIFAISLFTLVLLLVLISTTYEVISNSMNTKVNPVLNTFSVYTNSKLILTMKPLMHNEMVFLHGIRSLAIMWIVWGHTFSIDFWMAPLINTNRLFDQISSPFTMVTFSGYLAVDTFLMLSSMLMALSVFRELDKTNTLNISILFMKRYFRITVPLAAAILFNIGIYMHLSDGPFWKFIGGKLTEYCVDGWWTNLIYLANYLRPGKLCFGHSWYLMVDMQLYFLAPLVLYPIWKFKNRIGLVILLTSIIISCSVVYIILMFMLYDLRTSILTPTAPLKEVLIYTTAIGRLGSWMMGMLVGYLVHLSEGKTVKISSKLASIGWILAGLLLFGTIFIQYPLWQDNFLRNPWIIDALYDAFKPIVWGLVIGWIVIACHLSHSNIVKRFLSLSVWLPISKLSFCIYLTHLPVQAYFIASLRGPVYFTPSNVLYHFCGNFVMSFFAALIWALMFEYPTLKIITILLSKRKYRGQQKKNTSVGEDRKINHFDQRL